LEMVMLNLPLSEDFIERLHDFISKKTTCYVKKS
jgi:hypothetical protein